MNFHIKIIPKKFILFLFLLITTLINIQQSSAATSLQESPHKSHHHKHRHKHQFLTINSNQIHDIREAFAEYRNIVDKEKLNFEDIKPLRQHHPHRHHHHSTDEEETIPATHQHQGSDSSQLMHRHKRLPGSNRHPTTRVTTSTQATDEYDYNDDDENDATNRRANDDAHVQQDSSDSHQMSEGESLTSYKYSSLGTREGVKKSFEEMQRNQQDIHSLINQNIRRTRIDGMCRWPNKKVIEMPQHPSKIYTPRKYVIHMCSDDTSCCGSSSRTCVAKNSTKLTYWFHVRYANRTESVEPLIVTNHTECYCINKIPLTTRYTTTTIMPSIMLRTTRTTTSCRCPETFEAVYSNNFNCECKCEGNGAQCKLKHEGKEGFSLHDRRCILRGICTKPQCLYGDYEMNEGRCPVKSHHRHHQYSPR
ncbi:hypothetical protein PVAND_014874 [Polypedilum vanderplanki]|uniref:Platelet-derived growth factor (PDGF) family profile domain-containing protein n=1 Tax=Polypedilum vanderplanki TaxID=319348 RepID=A0A9J6BB00_POLVA|nr:hypothetical protein PVAND_014874 [Polypedilum vanderplanki]